jgi:hypothetical protein
MKICLCKSFAVFDGFFDVVVDMSTTKTTMPTTSNKPFTELNETKLQNYKKKIVVIKN